MSLEGDAGLLPGATSNALPGADGAVRNAKDDDGDDVVLADELSAESGDDGTVYSLDGELSKGTTVLIGTSS